jgi:uncharacterized protein YdcH (DUF465 family)
MEADEVRLIESLISGNDELRKLWQDHQYLNQKLDAMSAQTYLTVEEQLERRQMQKRKLAGRDRMAAILAEYNKK